VKCPLCGGDMRSLILEGYSHCDEHSCIICGTCNTCVSMPPTQERLAQCKARREVFEKHILPLIAGMPSRISGIRKPH
jgi:hypothetical protein